ncbi:hypothetical protein [Brevundimonas sp.]|uniref:hypothetical protein n=1 Tax=Brevundimonas sp. TaxID=1871086 RepID=UPI0027377D1F|nr:hypothetical protein [Brevundimonas sp.]MDP3800967.1 hypothetical protein [Brevundimonas sp.]
MSLAVSVLALALLAEPAAGDNPAAAAVQARAFADYPTYEQAGLRWVRAPSVRDLARHHRVTSRHFPYRGVAEVACTPDSRGRLTCEVISESPEGEDFGRAAQWVMRPVRVAATDGYSPEGRTFAFRLRFGNWPERLLPDSFHPVDQNLRWVKRPELVDWSLSGLGSQQEARASFDCVARGDGSLQCRSVDAAAPPGFVQAASRSLEDARVERTDNQPLEGSPLRWTFRLLNQSNCGSGGTGNGSPDAGRGAVAGEGSAQPGFDPNSAFSSGGSAAASRGRGSCMGAIVQMH